MALTANQKQLLRKLRTVARQLGEQGKCLTSLIGELSACDILNMRWQPSTGYDCVDGDGKKVEIKTRRDSKGGRVNPAGRMGRFGKRDKYRFNYGLFVELEPTFKVRAIYRLGRVAIERLEQKEKLGRGLHIHGFLSHRNVKRVFVAKAAL